jgi:hypothetical protein
MGQLLSERFQIGADKAFEAELAREQPTKGLVLLAICQQQDSLVVARSPIVHRRSALPGIRQSKAI